MAGDGFTGAPQPRATPHVHTEVDADAVSWATGMSSGVMTPYAHVRTRDDPPPRPHVHGWTFDRTVRIHTIAHQSPCGPFSCVVVLRGVVGAQCVLSNGLGNVTGIFFILKS
eukprot:m.69697 g.69697  ORF g.69697 m.69697 type:complete len:112 (+) comp18421_c0_seq2:557-892(+)